MTPRIGFAATANGPPRCLRQAAPKPEKPESRVLSPELRREIGLTQEDLAAAMNIKQPSLSKLESQDDMQISTLQRLVCALGGELELIAHMPGGDIRIRQFAQTG